MPVSSSFGVGDTLIASATATKRETLALVVDAATGTLDLVTERMPHLFFWFRQTVPPALSPATVQLQYMIRTDPAGNDEWLDLLPPVALVPNQPQPFFFEVPAVKIRATLTRTAGVVTTVEVVLGCAGA